MSIYAIVLTDPDDGAWAAVRKEWPNASIFFTDRIAFINVKKRTTTLEVSELVGMESTKKVNGIVVEADTISGWAPSSLGEWIEKNRG